jgi:phenylalanyl-tRNA synthetase alpha subunit
VAAGASVQLFKETCERALAAAVPGTSVRWQDHDYGGFVSPGLCAILTENGQDIEVLGGGMLGPRPMTGAGFNASDVAAFAWGLSLDRLAMLRFNMADIRDLWKPPYV